MKIMTKAVSNTAFLQFRDAEGELMWEGDGRDDDSRVGAWLFGPGSTPYQEAQSRNSNRTVDRLKARGKTDISPSERITETAEFLAAITDRFQNLEMEGKDKKALTGHALAVAVYSTPGLGFIANQVNGWAGDWGNFTKGSATS